MAPASASSATHNTALPHLAEDDAAARPFWPRLARAVGVLMLAVSMHVWGVRSSNPQATPFSIVASQVMAQLLGRPEVPLAPPLLLVASSSAVSTRRRAQQTVALPMPPSPAAFARSTTASAARLSRVSFPVGTAGFVAARRTQPDRIQPVPTAAVAAATSSSNATVGPADAESRPAPVEYADTAGLATATDEPTRGPAAPAERAEPVVSEQKQKEVVRAVLDRYSRSYDRLDVQATKAVYPSVNAVQLRRLFEGLEEQRVRLADCEFKISGDAANARCKGEASYRPKIGSGVIRAKNPEWTFNLARDGGEWQILNARMQ